MEKGKLWWIADDMTEAVGWIETYSKLGVADFKVVPHKDNSGRIDVVFELEKKRALEILGYEPDSESWLDEEEGAQRDAPASKEPMRYYDEAGDLTLGLPSHVLDPMGQEVEKMFQAWLAAGMAPRDFKCFLESTFHTIYYDYTVEKALGKPSQSQPENQRTTIDAKQLAFVREKMKPIVADTLGVDVVEVTDDASFGEDLGADSLDAVELAMALEEEFEVEITDKAVEEIATVKEAIAYIAARVPGSTCRIGVCPECEAKGPLDSDGSLFCSGCGEASSAKQVQDMLIHVVAERLAVWHSGHEGEARLFYDEAQLVLDEVDYCELDAVLDWMSENKNNCALETCFSDFIREALEHI